VSTRCSGCARSVARELSIVASFSDKFASDCESEVTCGDVKEISGIEPSVNNLEPGVISSICDVGDLAEDIRGSAGSVLLETGTGEDDGGMSGTVEGGSPSNPILYSRSTAPLDENDGEIAVEATMTGRVSDFESSMGEITGAAA
jgi:hypothetical protein